MIEKYLIGIFDEYKIDQKHYHNVFISITEAVNNAIIHGNGEDANKFVHINSEKKIAVFLLRFQMKDMDLTQNYSGSNSPRKFREMWRQRGIFNA